MLPTPLLKYSVIKSDWKRMSLFKWQCYDHFWPFFAICIFIFHKTEFQTILLRWLTCLNLNWFKSYGLRCNLRPRASSANSQKIATDKWPCNYRTWPFFANYMFIFHKTDIKMVILSCLKSLNLNRYKSYDQKCKNAKNANVWFCTKSQKNGNGSIRILFHNFWSNQKLDQLSTTKWPPESQFCERWTYIWPKKWPEMVVTLSSNSTLHFRSDYNTGTTTCTYSLIGCQPAFVSRWQLNCTLADSRIHRAGLKEHVREVTSCYIKLVQSTGLHQHLNFY